MRSEWTRAKRIVILDYHTPQKNKPEALFLVERVEKRSRSSDLPIQDIGDQE